MVIEAPAWGLLSIGFLFTFAFCWTFDKTFRTLFAPLMKKVAGIGFGGVRGVGSVHPFGFLNTIVANVEAWTANGMKASERGLTYSINQLIDTAGLLIGLPVGIALVLYELAHYVGHLAVKTVTRVEHTTVIKKITTVAKTASAVTRTQFDHLTARVRALEHRTVHVAKSVAGTVANPFPRIRTVEHDLTKLGKRVKSVEKQLAVGVGAALLVRTLTKLGLGWLRCGNVKKAGKSVCGMNPGLLESLLLDAALLTVTFDLEQFARELQTVTEEASSLIHRWAT